MARLSLCASANKALETGWANTTCTKGVTLSRPRRMCRVNSFVMDDLRLRYVGDFLARHTRLTASIYTERGVDKYKWNEHDYGCERV